MRPSQRVLVASAIAALMSISAAGSAEDAQGGVVHKKRTQWTSYYWFPGPDISKIYQDTSKLNKPLWGLEELAKRQGQPDAKFITEAGGLSTPERTIFHDPAYGTEIWKLIHHTNSYHIYGDLSPWNANGEVMFVKTKRGSMLVDGTGETVRPLEQPEPLRISHQPCWDRKDPHVFYTPVRWNPKLKEAEQPRGIYRYNFRTGEKKKLYDVTRVEFESPLSVDGEWMCFKIPNYSAEAMRNRIPDYSNKLNRENNWGVGLARTDGSKFIWIRGGVHTIRVVGGKDYLFEVEQKFIDRQGRVHDTGINKNTHGSHHTYSWSGTRIISHSASGFQIADIHGTRVVNLRNLFTDYKRWVFGGHTSWLCDDDDWCFASGFRGTFKGLLIKIRTDGSGTIHPIAYYNSTPKPGGDYWASPRAACSPDGTKYMFDSRSFRETVFSYVAVVKRPNPPQYVTVRDTTPGNVKIGWAPPYHHNEVKGYHVYRAGKSGGNFVQITDEPVTTTEFVDTSAKSAGDVAYYIVTTVEHSGLESSCSSNEVGVVVGQSGYPKDRAVRNFVEAEGNEGPVYPPVREARDVSAAGDTCIWHGPGQGTGRAYEGDARLYINYTPPRLGDYYLWARVKSPKEGALEISAAGEGEILPRGFGHEVTKYFFDVPDTKGKWFWIRTRSGQPYKIVQSAASRNPRQERILSLESLCPGVKIDRFAWTTEKDWTPVGRGNFDETPPSVPKDLKAKSVAKGHVRISWGKNAEKDLRYYNVYASTEGAVTVEQKHLLLSPSRTYAIDWGIPQGKTVSYAVTAVDRAGNESAPAFVTPKP